MLPHFMWVIIFWLLFTVPAYATDYYLSPAGNDANSGTSLSTPWRTCEKINAKALQPYDRILIVSGQTLPCQIYLDASDRGPITVTSSDGSTRGTIHSLSAYNVGQISVIFLNIRGGTSADGVTFYSDLPSRLPNIWIERVDVSGFPGYGMIIGSWNGQNGYDNIHVIDSEVHDNGNTGLLFYGQFANTHTRVYVGGVRAHHNTGRNLNGGSGIVLGSIKFATVEWNSAWENGAQGNRGVGIWTYDSSYIWMHHNESHHNHAAGGIDGGGFDLDGGVTNSTLESNASYNNDGPGYLLVQYVGAAPWSNNIVQGNRSVNDGLRSGDGGIQFFDSTNSQALRNASVQWNSIENSRGPGIWLRHSTVNTLLRENTVRMTAGTPPIKIDAPQPGLQMIGNSCSPTTC